jgi:hypothetical protein
MFAIATCQISSSSSPANMGRNNYLPPSPANIGRNNYLPPSPANMGRNNYLPPSPANMGRNNYLPPSPVNMGRNNYLPPSHFQSPHILVCNIESYYKKNTQTYARFYIIYLFQSNPADLRNGQLVRTFLILFLFLVFTMHANKCS